jgi:hypothetical protein
MTSSCGERKQRLRRMRQEPSSRELTAFSMELERYLKGSWPIDSLLCQEPLYARCVEERD